MAESNGSVQYETLVEELRSLYNADRSRAETLIEAYLDQALIEYTTQDKVAYLLKLIDSFGGPDSDIGTEVTPDQQDFLKMSQLLLGHNFPVDNLSSKEITEKLSNSLNRVFDSLNEIIGVINSSLLGSKEELETIRHVISSDMKDKQSDSLQSYLDQIQTAFLTSHQAFQEAATSQIKKVLDELDPDRISAELEKGFKFGLLRKAEMYGVYNDKFRKVQEWFQSERMKNELLREFENICVKKYKEIENR